MYACITFCLSIHLLTIWAASTFSYCWIILLWTWVYKYLFDILLSILLGMYAQVELLDFIVILFFIFWKAAILFSIVAAPSYVPTSNAPAFLFLYIFTNTCYFLLVVVFVLQDSHANAYEVVFIVVLICISLMVSDVELICTYLMAICIPFLEKFLLKYLSIFKLDFFPHCWGIGVLYIFWTLNL